ncbi:lysophospholipid acyltransferase family protein [Neisseria chenwenguii]|uniref:1-acyl-sn-glycerol-3-phosphate acyltransferase n=1 Tax=Neisseria chenwenguii TaxID=1853278 RepID=A0A220S2J3_9NEIS|nr:lysophospholipid acyltransferase family protein [Neisseria chenwenguii]ASK27623.1 1-acyl-sn-glycerol-3-phosphate acyltransferase [Neisseria chenwenguii]ROV54447.1 1-acyl-sn-glycerol-3-phosphate acyltransferase [Neisseria chenwenguii]
MLLIKNLIYWLILATTLIALFPFMLAGALFPGGAHKMAQVWVAILNWSLKHVIGLKYTLIGAENIPDRPSIICSKHQSGWETLALQEIFPPQVYVAKRELFKIPFFGWGLKLVKTIGIDRSNRRESSELLMQQGLARKNEGYWIAIFPEGTRLPPGQRGKYKLGGARMAKMFEMDMVPVALNSGEFWPKNSFLKYPGEITVVVGKPIAHNSGDEAAMMAECENWIEARQAEITGRGPFAPKKAV